jgi:glycosyltransferase involved in cell wall biosynthesis
VNIVYLHQYFKTPAMAGGTRSYEMALRLVRKGHQVHVVTSSTDVTADSGGWVVEKIDGITVHWLPVAYSNSMGFARRLLAFSDFARKAGKYASKLEADVVFATSTPLTIAIPGIKASRALKAPMVFEVRDLWPDIPIALGVLKSPVTKFLARRLEHWAYRNASQIVGLSPGMCAGVTRSGYPPDRVHCIPNSADIDLFAVSDESGKDFRRSRPWLGGRPLVVYAGTFGRVNGIGYLVEMAMHSLELNPDIRFLAVGEGIERAEVEERAQIAGVLDHNFFIEPPVSKSSMPALLNAATITTSLVIDNRSLWDNSANKFFDSLAAGRPIFVNHGGWQADLLAETGAGFEVPGNDPKEAARRVCEFVDNPDEIRKAGLAAMELAETRFERNVLAQQLESVLELALRDAHD